MVDYGTAYVGTPQVPYYPSAVLTTPMWDPRDFGTARHARQQCGFGGGEEGVIQFICEIPHTLFQTQDMRYTITFDSTVLIEQELVHTGVSIFLGFQLADTGIPGPIISTTVVPSYPAPRSLGSYFSKDIYEVLPEFKELEPLVELLHMRKYDSYKRVVDYVNALQEFVDQSYISEAINLKFPYKTWPEFPVPDVRHALERNYDPDTATRIAESLKAWSEQHALDEEDNWRTVEIWADGLAPRYEY